MRGIIILLLTLCLSACARTDYDPGQTAAGLEKVPFSVEVRQNQFVTVCDIFHSRILGYIWHWNDSGSFALMDQMFIWNMEKQELEKKIAMNQEYLFSAVLDGDGGIYVGCADVEDCEGERWSLLYCGTRENKFAGLKDGTSSLLAGWGSPWLAHVGNNIVGVYEERNESGKTGIGCIAVDGGNIRKLTEIKWDENVKYLSGKVAASEEKFAYLVEKEDGSFLRVVNPGNGEVLEFPWKKKGYDFAIAGEQLLQSGQGEQEGQYVLHRYDLGTGAEESDRVKGPGFRMTPVGENAILSVDSFFNVCYTRIGNGGIEESYMDLPENLKERSVRFLTDEKGQVFFVYEDMPQGEAAAEIYRCRMQTEK
ncbi:MAG: hypothetical protein Q4C65_00265 [Eubacteriales bacterium]|nr:hypothetical protein [Eubacteriales bacterium]